MNRIGVWLLTGALATAMSLSAQMRGRGGPGCCGGAPCVQASARGPLPGSSSVELKGNVARVQITPGEGMPYVEVKAGNESTRVYLGSMRYLVAQGFSPKMDDEIVVKGYKLNGDLMATSVTLPDQNKTLSLRDENGWPAWRGGNCSHNR